MKGICRLCWSSEELRDSHVLPKFFFRHIKASTDSNYLYSGKRTAEFRKIQDGPKESLLCQKCEEKFNRLETYASKLFYWRNPDKLEEDGWKRFDDHFELNGIQAETMRLFELSIIWRLSISRSFKVHLGKYEATIRTILLDEKISDFNAFGCIWQLDVLTDLPDRLALSQVVMIDPKRVVLQLGRVHSSAYRFWLGGVRWVWLITSEELPEDITRFFLIASGRRIVPFKLHSGLGPLSQFAVR